MRSLEHKRFSTLNTVYIELNIAVISETEFNVHEDWATVWVSKFLMRNATH